MYKKRHFNSKQTFKMCSRPEPRFFQCVSNKVFAMGNKFYQYFLTVTYSRSQFKNKRIL